MQGIATQLRARNRVRDQMVDPMSDEGGSDGEGSNAEMEEDDLF